jgi:hypothetical protein
MRLFAAVFQKTLRKVSHGSAKFRMCVSIHQTICHDFDELVVAQVLLV